MTYLSNTEIETLFGKFADLTLPKPEWTHRAHFAAAAWLVADPLRDAEGEMPNMIRAYNTACGVANSDTDGYHETITLASIHLLRAFMDRLAPDTPLFEALNAVLASPLGQSSWPLTFWSEAVLFSIAARRNWIEPNLRPLEIKALS